MQRNLCGYFWLIMLCLFIKIPVILLVIVAGIAFSPIWVPMVGLIFLFCWAMDRWNKRKEQAKIKAGLHPWDDWPSEPKQPGLFRSWWRAKKEKICPMIEWED